MDYEETMVEENFDDVATDDTLPDDIVESDESEEEDYSEEELEIPDEEEVEEAEPEPEPPRSEPGWIKQRVQKAVDKAVAQALAQQQEQFNAQMAPILAKMMEDEARELVSSRQVANLELAKEIVQLRHGQGAVPQPTQPRNEQGQFVSKEQIANDAATQAKIDMLAKQADKIKANGGPDVIDIFTNDENIKRQVIDGEIDFYDVAEMAKKKKRTPSPSRSPNGASNVTPNAFATMSSEQFQRMERQIDRGVRYTMK